MEHLAENRWRLHRVGLINFWYYDEEEFSFLDGRMLLRGSNGSGKSVTMQSFIPLLLDGNMRPERLDPFGSKARKMENYLLEEEDDREERTGYLFMELKRSQSDQYLTLGIGLRGRRGKKLESWYFLLTDGRRVGKDFLLYKDLKSRIPYSKTELRNRIAEGGYVLESQREYMEMVNQKVFGFETMDEYEELLKLLIQLRTPKLSKDFKPTVINDILSNSLQTLSEDDLRPMSEAIENMDNIRTNMENLKTSIRAARLIGNIYQKYNQFVLYEKSGNYISEQEKLTKQKKELNALAGQLEEGKKQADEKREEYERLGCQQENLEEEIRNLEKNDAFSLAEKEKKLQAECDELSREKKNKEAQEEIKRDARIENDARKKEVMGRLELSEKWIQDAVEELLEGIGDVPFDAAAFFAKEFQEELRNHFSFAAHEKELSDYKEKIKQGVLKLQKEAKEEEKYQNILQEMEEKKKEREETERKTRQMEELFQAVKEELLERIYRWKKENEVFSPSEESMAEVSKTIMQYQFGEDPAGIRECFSREKNAFEGELRTKLALKHSEEKARKEEYDSICQERKAWEEQKEPQPVRDAAVERNRERLAELGIPADPFYKVVQFAEGLSVEECDRLEEILERMGILDALVVPAQYRKQVLALEAGNCDRYIFTDAAVVQKNLMEALAVDQEEQDIVAYMNVSRVLQGISLSMEEATGIDLSGKYRLGILEGTITGKYQASFIGAAARERYRREHLEILLEKEAQAKEALEQTKVEIAEISKQLEQLKEEWDKFPSADGVRSTAKDLEQLEQKLSGIRTALEQISARLLEQRQILDEVRGEVQKACQGTWLTIRLDVFESALETLEEYQKGLYEIKNEYVRLESYMERLTTLEEREQEILSDLDNLRYDLQKILQNAQKTQGELKAVQEQLSLTDYEQIKEQLENCLKQRKELPERRERCVQLRERLEGQCKNLAQKIEELEKKCAQGEGLVFFLQEVFEKEWNLGYVELEGGERTLDIHLAQEIKKQFESLVGDASFEELNGRVQAVFHENKGYLLEYGLMAQSIFTELCPSDAGNAKGFRSSRLDLRAKYKGTSIAFMELLARLEEDLKVQEHLLSDQDKELFEDILANTISKKIRVKIHQGKRWVKNMNALMESMQTSSGLRLSLRWRSCKAEKEGQLDTRELVELLEQDAQIMTEKDTEKLSRHFRSKISEARNRMEEKGNVQSFHSIMREILDYRQWFEFQLESQKTGEKKKELTDRVFFTFSGGEKAMAMYVPLFSAVVAKFSGANMDAPRIISLDEAFAGVDAMNIKDMFRLMVEFEFDFIINSQILWGDCETVPGLAIYQLLRPQNAKYVSVIPYVWNGTCRELVKEGAGEKA